MGQTPPDKRRIFLIVGRIVLGAVFIFAAYAKLRPQPNFAWSPSSVKVSVSLFALQVASYQLLPDWGVNFVARALPPFELFLGLWLLSGIALRYSSLFTTLLLGTFFLMMLRSFSLHQEISCACFGPGEKIGPKTLTRDGALVLLALGVTLAAFRAHKERAITPSHRATAPSPERAG